MRQREINDEAMQRLFEACIYNAPGEMERILQRTDIDPNQKYEDKTPLEIASLEGYRDIVELLIEHHLVVDSREGYQALHFACERGHVEIAELLLGKVVQRRGRVASKLLANLLYTACESGKLEIVKLLIEGYARDPFIALERTEYGIPLAIAAARNFQPIVDYFWEQGVPYLEEEKRNNRGFQR
ncbi:ankyrin repeat domain-containing T4SS effector AnkF [Coxiella burnetii]|uniref:ankyrin repeat domain-containing T4SS effector AnkF n=3 Tax=Coxiella burnetii TaxID=777 RepID=UPI0001631884|nr:ankyrin repeat domain-containing T4SS effector AnkF [Coxiella burnetii]ACJ20585.1 ankyrin repeat protein [Coxiella burnetii CbuK_Q154]ATN86207.1 hypothetical protein AYO29_07010 [Coxiella burnetii str. Schperling]EDQ95148.1 hypothetical protein A35_07190 [Coxiella burnetii 'MSU Goat Q177']PHH57309.1 ankyrin repeat domain-containing protein [Coxiella burnetii]UYK70102.1 ankyrin repeat domain-containing T4SS effector AnkF [Coxiella burnetii]